MIYNRKWKRRRGVLGYWHELKQKLYAEYLRGWHEGLVPSLGGVYQPSAEPIPV